MNTCLEDQIIFLGGEGCADNSSTLDFDCACLLFNNQYNTIQQYNLLFTLGSVYSTSASGAEQTIETNNSNIT